MQCHSQAEEEARRNLEEEHRLAYVAMTRAKERLYLTVLRRGFRKSSGSYDKATEALWVGRLDMLGYGCVMVRVLVVVYALSAWPPPCPRPLLFC